jgi:hypothetical protein
MEKIRTQWAGEKAAGLWDERHLEQQRKARRAWLAQELSERELRDPEFKGGWILDMLDK